MFKLSAVFLIVGVDLLLVACTEREVARVGVPGTNLTVVLVEDEKQMFRYHVVADDRYVSQMGFLGPHDDDVALQPTVNIEENKVTFTWRGSRITQFVQFDVESCQLLRDSGEVRAIKIPRCRKS